MSAKNFKDAVIDTSNPYYVHHSDQPRHLLVPEKLNDSNYPTWSKSMTHALITKNKIGFIDAQSVLLQRPSSQQNTLYGINAIA